MRMRALGLGSIGGAKGLAAAVGARAAASRTGMHALLVAASIPEVVRVAE